MPAGRLLIASNLLKAWLLLAGFCAVFAGAGWLLGGYRLLSIFLFCALLAAGAAYWYGERAALGMLNAREAPLAEAPALHSTAERLAAVAGVAKPRVYVMRDAHLRVASAGRGVRGSAIAVSAGLLGAASPAELEGLLAHEIAHVRHRDVLVQTTAVLLAGTLVELSRVGGFLQRALLFVLGPVAAAIVHGLLSPKREFAADVAAAALCGSPHGLADALVRLEQAGEFVDFSASPATEPLYTINPFEEQGLGALFDTHPATAERVRRLRELDPAWRERLRAA